MDWKQFAWIEFVRGAVATLVTFFIIGPWVLLVSPLGGLLWMLGGTYNKAIRRFGLPALVAIAVQPLGFINLVSFGLGVGILHLGDGFPDHRPTTQSDGSWLGRLVEKCITADDSIGGPLTKWIIVALFQLSLIPYFFN